MQLFMLLLSLFSFSYALYSWTKYLLQKPFVRSLSAYEPQPNTRDKAPLLSVILAARNEEGSIRTTLASLLSQQGVAFELIAVNDRSTDGTGQAIDETFDSSTRQGDLITCQAIHLEELPTGWLGKNHALYQGYLRARGDLLLFTDADIRYAPGLLAQAVHALQSEQADHVTIAPKMEAKSFLLGAFVRFFLYSLGLFTEPWRANDDTCRHRSIGIGAFNLLTRQAYESVGTHRALAFRPDDDLRLGRLVKERGMRQRLLTGWRALEVEWYPSLKEAFLGLEKNLFSGFGYRYITAAGAALGQLAVFVYPAVSVLAGALISGTVGSLTLSLSAATYLLLAVLYVQANRDLSGAEGARLWPEAFFHPVSALLLVYVILRSAMLAGWRGGVYWRGTFYSLEELKRNP